MGPGGSGPGLEGDALTLVRKANWAIEKVTGDIGGRFSFNTAIAAVMELVNELYRHPDADPAARRFAVATAASLVFPFAPHLGSEVYEMLTGARVWEEPWPTADPEMLVADTSCSSARSTARSATGSRPPPAPRARSSSSWPWPPAGSRRTSTATRWSR